MDGLSAERIVELFEKDVSSRKRLAELLVVESDVRLAIINAIIRDVATKEDIEKLRAATKEDIKNLGEETKKDIENLRKATKEDIENLRKATKEDIENLRKATKEDIENLRKATKEDIENLRKTTKEDIGRLEARINSLDVRISRLEGQMSLFVKLFIAFNLPILLGIIGMLLKLAFTG
jgi:DNA repair exonuclease SbcCD ATPase subunit